MDTAMYKETFDSLQALSEMGLSRVTDAVSSIIEIRRLYAKAVIDNGQLWIVNTGKAVLPLAPENPANCPLEGALIGVGVAVFKDSFTYLEPLSKPDEQDDLAEFWWSAHRFYDTMEMHTAAKHDMHQLFPGKHIFEQVGDLTLRGMLS